MDLSDLKQKLQEMAQLSILANRISEVQEKNLKMFPLVFFDNVAEAKVDYDLGHGIKENTKEVNHASRVSYYILYGMNIPLLKNDDANSLRNRCLNLQNAVRQLFWKDIKVEVYINREKVYESEDV